MIRFTTAAVLFGLLSAMALSPAWADSSTEPALDPAPGPATDATTPMDAEAGNLREQPDNTLSNSEVRRLQGKTAPGVTTAPAATTQMPVGVPLSPGQPLDNHSNSQ